MKGLWQEAGADMGLLHTGYAYAIYVIAHGVYMFNTRTCEAVCVSDVVYAS